MNRKKKKKCHALTAVSLSEDLSCPLADMRFTQGGGHVRLVEDSASQPSFPLVFSPPFISLTDSSAEVFCTIDELHPRSEPTFC